MDKLEYNNLMKALTERLNLCLKNNECEELNKTLFYLLVVMYKNKCGENPNIGAILQLIGGNVLPGLASRFEMNSNLTLKFNEEKNELIFGGIFVAKFDYFRDCPFEIFLPSYGLQIVVKNRDVNDAPFWGNDVDVFGLWGDTMWIEHKGPEQNGINHKPYQVKSYEKRTFDLYGIEMEREISTEFRLGISAFKEACVGEGDIAGVGSTINTTKVYRDPVYFKMAKIETMQKNFVVSENTQVKYCEGVLDTKKSSFSVKQEFYGLCPLGVSLDVNQTTDTFDEALHLCMKPWCLNAENDDKFYKDIYPKPHFLGIEEEVEKRKQAAMQAYKNNFAEGNKSK